MAQIRIERQHRIDSDEMRDRVEALAKKLVVKHGGQYRWQGNRVHYSYTGGLDAWVEYNEDNIKVEIRLGLLMSAFKGMIQSEVEAYLDEKIA